MVISELGISQGSFSYVTPSSDLDLDDTTLGKQLTESHREFADYRNPEGVSVSQSSLSVVFDRTGKLVGEMSINRLVLLSQKHVQCSQQVSENTLSEKMVDRTGKTCGRKQLKCTD